jgi:hypothetical protein
MFARLILPRFFFAAFLSALLGLPAAAQQDLDSPSSVTNQYLLTAQRFAKIWVETKPWPARYSEYLSLIQEEFAPLLSEQALAELRAKPTSGPRELLQPNAGESDEDEVYEGMIACVANAHFTVLGEQVQGDRAVVEVETTVSNPFGSGKTESFQDQLVLVRENGRWVLTPEAFRTFAF